MPALDIAAHTGPIVVTLGYVVLYYGLMGNVARVKAGLSRDYAARGEKFDRYFNQDRQMLAADRMQLNTLEHMGPFLALMWLVALFAGPTWATAGGAVYLLSRLLYPLLMGERLGRGVRASIFIATLPGYLVVLYFVVVLGVALLGWLPA